ncbi:MAG: SDR family oxidoreductase [Dehalococcoidia bacterium]|nr:MAG: SDR family oxidoreductase [Dehalococcoidia bacterium]
MSIEGQRVVIIGGSSGIGLGVALHARAAGAHVTIGGRTVERLQAASRALGEVDVVTVDIGDQASVEAVFAPIDHVDHVVICAGTVGPSPVLGSNIEALRAVVEQRLWGAVYTVRAAAPKMQGGSITFTSGGVAARPRVGAAITTAALGAVEALTLALALELAPTRVNCVTPGLVATPLHGSGPAAEARLAERARTLPAGRVGTPDDLALVYLMLMNNPYLTGEVIHIDGGGRYI